MSLQDQTAEPSMEEILASIRRIISEEDEPAGAPEPILELNQTAPPSVDDDIVFDAEPEDDFIVDDMPPPMAPTPAPPMVQAAAQVIAQVIETPVEQPIVSRPAANAAAGSLQRLAGGLRIADTANQTVEGVVRELLKPMLKEWLDENLPAIVEARVEAELERISRLAR